MKTLEDMERTITTLDSQANTGTWFIFPDTIKHPAIGDGDGETILDVLLSANTDPQANAELVCYLRNHTSEIIAAIKELKQYRETMGRVFEKAKIARLNMYVDKDRSYEHLVEIREIEEALKEGKAILMGEKNLETEPNS